MYALNRIRTRKRFSTSPSQIALFKKIETSTRLNKASHRASNIGLSNSPLNLPSSCKNVEQIKAAEQI